MNKILNKLKTTYMNLGIGNKMNLLNSFIILFVALVIGTSSFYLYAQTINNELAIVNLRDIKQVSTGMDHIFHDVEELSSFITSDNNVQEIINADTIDEDLTDEESYIKYMLNNLLISKDYISFISIYADNGFEYYVAADGSNNIPDFDEVKDTEYYIAANEARGSAIWKYIHDNNSEYIIDNKFDKISMFRTVLRLNNYETKAYMMIGLNTANFREIYNGNLSLENSSVLIVDENSDPLFVDSYIPGEIDELYTSVKTSISESNDDSKITKFNGKKYLLTFSSLENVDWKIVNIIPMASFNTNTNYVPILIIMAVVLGITLGIIFTMLTSSLITRPVKNLLESMRRVKDGNFTEYVGFKYNDEIGRLGSEYDQMISRINDLINKVYVAEIEEKKAELKALQAQINPHFLYNTLDTIYWKAVSGDNESVQESINALSKLFRLALNFGNEMSLVSQEKEFIGYYILLQGIRYKNKFEYEIKFDEATLNYKIPKLILQPFVENAIIHGLEVANRKTFLKITSILDGEYIHFTIRDNGPGIPEEKLNQIMSNSDAKSYGIRNVRNRLALYYNNDFEFDVNSQIDKGTEISIRIPTTASLEIRR